jgi:hypothetical protein
LIRLFTNRIGRTVNNVNPATLPVAVQMNDPVLRVPDPEAERTQHPPGQQPRQSRRYPRRMSKTIRHRGPGFGVYSCSNCSFFDMPYREITQHGCGPDGIARPTTLPCALERHNTGHFEPREIPEDVAGLNLDEMSLDSLAILRWAAWRAEIRKRSLLVESFKIGDRVVWHEAGIYVRGIVVSRGKRHLKIRTDGTEEIQKLRPEDLRVVPSRMASEPRSFRSWR